MKKLYFSLLVFSFFSTTIAQIVNIPDARFKAMLVESKTTNEIAKNLSGLFFKVDANNDGQIQENEALNVSYLNVSNYYNVSKISNLSGILSFLNLKNLDCSSNLLTSLDVSSLVNLTHFDCSRNNLSSLGVIPLVKLIVLDCSLNNLGTLEVTTLVDLVYFNCRFNQLTSLNVSSLENLSNLYCENNLLTAINFPIVDQSRPFNVDLSNNLFESLELISNIYSFVCENLPKLKSLNTKNVNFPVYLEYVSFPFGDIFIIENCPNLEYICCNENNLQAMQIYLDTLDINCHVNSYCSFTPGGSYYTIQGNQKLDSNNNGCDVSDFSISNLKYTITNVTTAGSFISDASGNYSIPVQAGTHTISPVLENPTYFTVSPSTANITFPTQTSPFTQYFCITPNGVHPDLQVALLPLVPARPGFDAKYRLVYKNKGNQLQSGKVTLDFDDAVLDLAEVNPIQTSQNATSLSWNFSDLQPFETREISFTMNVNSPQEIPAVINGDVLAYTATITSSATDETPSDNTFTFNQIVVGSYDPNDKTCLEGTVITPDLIGQYVHYLIRFENTGTFAAENVVVKDMIDLTKFDISTLVPTSASHSFTTRISEGNKVEFIFENINLPFDDANNDGYVAFKIKTKPTLKVGDSIENEASIFFDFNFPIITEPAISTFRNPVTSDFDFDAYFSAYPIPANQVLNLIPKKAINIDSISIYNNLGQVVLVITKASKVPNIDVSSLSAGNYFIKITTDKGITSSRFVKN